MVVTTGPEAVNVFVSVSIVVSSVGIFLLLVELVRSASYFRLFSTTGMVGGLVR